MSTVSDFLNDYKQRLAYSVDDLTACEYEPIGSCGAIQSLGYFVSADINTLRILSLSENILPLLKQSAESLLTQSLDQIMVTADKQPMNLSLLQELRHKKFPQVYLKLSNSETLQCQAHLNFADDTVLIDIEAHGSEREKFSHEHLHRLISRLESSSNLATDCQMVCEAFQDIASFDRVMAYRFHENWDGEVIAEIKAHELESFLGLRYPASDIPEQARQLYLKSPYRMIVDTHELPIEILTRSPKERRSVRLGMSTLRASSPIHIEYLQNMGVRSSFSVPIKVHNKLWGLISCHHYSAPLILHPEVRSALELIGRILSGRIAGFIEKRRLLAKKRSLEFSQTFIRKLTDGMPTKESFQASKDQLLAMVEANGVFVRIQGEELGLGECPPRAVIDRILKRAREVSVSEIWKTHSLKDTLELERTPIEAAGALIVPLSFGFEDYIVWFRPVMSRDVRWGGDPSKLANTYGRLTPRASFAAWVEKVKDQARPWNEENEESAQYLLFHFIKGIFSKAAALAEVNRELERVTRAKDEFIGLVSHELRTPLSAVIGWIEILKDSVSIDNSDAMEAIEHIDRNANVQIHLINDLLDISRIISGKLRLALKSNVRVGPIAIEVIESLRPYAESKGTRLDLYCDDDISVSADAERLRQLLWNLVSNAIKFTPRNGEVKLRVQKLSTQYRIVVEDNGIGLEGIHVKRVFERFNQVEADSQIKGGLGLGLAIAKSLVELHGGLIYASSEGLGKGSTFVAELPIFSASHYSSEIN